jgi:hypothetical protein
LSASLPAIVELKNDGVDSPFFELLTLSSLVEITENKKISRESKGLVEKYLNKFNSADETEVIQKMHKQFVERIVFQLNRDSVLMASHVKRINHADAHEFVVVLRKYGLFLHDVDVNTAKKLAAELAERGILSAEDAGKISSFAVQFYFAPTSHVERCPENQFKLIPTEKS